MSQEVGEMQGFIKTPFNLGGGVNFHLKLQIPFPLGKIRCGKWKNHLLVITDQRDRTFVVQLKDTSCLFSCNELLKFIERKQPHNQYSGAVY